MQLKRILMPKFTISLAARPNLLTVDRESDFIT